jgi:hypothetical protein
VVLELGKDRVQNKEDVRITDNITYQRRVLGGESVTLTNSLVFIVPDSTMMFIHLSVHVMLMGGYKHPWHTIY